MKLKKSLKKLKNNKSSGEDTIINEYLKHSFSVFNLVFKREVNNLPKQLIIVIDLKLLGSSLSPLFLYNGVIFPDNQSSGIQPLPNIILNSFT
jgi:hypothetical protein